ncbi:MAG TPA: isochorismate synthase [Trebonia sp.]
MVTSSADALVITTRPLPEPVALLSWLPSPHGALSWVRQGDGLVGWGVAARLTARGDGRFAQALRWWQRLTAAARIRDDLGTPGSGPVAFASMAFADHPGHSVLILPKVVVGRRDGVSWMTTVGSPTVPASQPVAASRGVRYRHGWIGDTAHRRSVAAAISRIKAGELDKVVLARDLLATADRPLDERYVLARLAAEYPTSWVYAVDGLIGATPELLLRRERDSVSARLLAGTTWPRPGRSSAASLARDLLASGKNRAEHRYAVQSLVEALAPFCSRLDVPHEPSVLHLPNLSHLATEVHGTLAADAPLLDLVARVHPTAAVAGSPRSAAMRLISELEPMDRGGYLGPVGWLDAQGNGEFGVALRCARLRGETVRLFAGGGVVADSDPDTEAEEVAAKFRVFQSALTSR